MNKFQMLIILLLAASTGCSSAPKSAVDLGKIGEEEVIQTYHDKNDDLKTSHPFEVDGGKVIAVGMATIAADSGRIESAVKVAQMRAKSTLAHTISEKLNSYAQFGSEGNSYDADQLRELIEESSKLTANEFKLGRTHVERIRIIGDSGVPRTELRAWSEVYLSLDTYKHLVLESIRQQQNKRSMSDEFLKTVNSSWERMISDEDQHEEAAAPSNDKNARKPSSVNDEE